MRTKISKSKRFTAVVVGCLVVVGFSTNAQTNNTIVNDGSAWSVLRHIVVPAPPIYTDYYFFDGDSVFNGKTYKKVFCCTDEQHIECSFQGLMREENQKTYYIRQNTNYEDVLYDFSLKTGDILKYEVYGEDTIFLYAKTDTVKINNEYKKRMLIIDCPSSDCAYAIDTLSWELAMQYSLDIIIENIGSLKGLFYPSFYGWDGIVYDLLCYTRNGELFYQNPTYATCYYSNLSVVSIDTQNDISIFPNPSTGQLTISLPNPSEGGAYTAESVEIYDIVGKNLPIKRHCGLDPQSPANTQIDVSHLANGIYFMKIQTDKGMSVKKIVKQ